MNGGGRLGRSGIGVPALGFGGVPLGNLYRPMDEAAAAATVAAALSGGMRYFDTAPLYGYGLSERRLGLYLRDAPRDELVISTKIGRTLFPRRGPAGDDIFVDAPPFDHRFDFTYDAVMRQFEASLQRLGTNRLDAIVIHDLGLWHMKEQAVVDRHFADLAEGGLRALAELRRDGLVGAIGAGANELTLCDRFLALGEIDFILLALRYTLLDRSGADFLDRARAAGVGVVVGAPFQSGILATGVGAAARYNYGDVSPEVVTAVRRIEAVCAAHGVPLKAAALQFPLRNPAVVSVLAGMGSVTEVRENLAAAAFPTGDDFWSAIERNNASGRRD
jgi:D-threo-aldose 1-dehydrogenase